MMTTMTQTVTRTILKRNQILEATIKVWEVQKKKEWIGTNQKKKLKEKIEEKEIMTMM